METQQSLFLMMPWSTLIVTDSNNSIRIVMTFDVTYIYRDPCMQHWRSWLLDISRRSHDHLNVFPAPVVCRHAPAHSAMATRALTPPPPPASYQQFETQGR